MKRVLHLLILMLSAGFTTTIAAEVTPLQVQRQIEAWIQRSPRIARGLPLEIIHPVKSIKNNDKSADLAYYANLNPGGFVIITPDDELHPVLAFSEHGQFDPVEDPDNTLLILLKMDMQERMEVLKKGLLTADYRRAAREAWRTNEERAGSRLQRSAPGAQLQWQVEVGPLLSSAWDQDHYIGDDYIFDYYTPQHYVCGCVATAASQILYYHRWPLTGTWAHSYSWNSQTLSADFGQTTYDWANMVDNYASPGNEPLIKRQAAGLISYHTGIAVDMDYSDGGSGANTAVMQYALKKHFRHHSDYVEGTDDSFFTRLYANMIAGTPAEMSIRAILPSPAGHAIVVDGIRHEATGTHYYHLNMGWSGYHNAWYDLSAPFTAGGYTWSTLSGVVLDIVPIPDMSDPGETLYTGDFDVAWAYSPTLPTTAFELQQAQISATPAAFFDGAEAQLAGWSADGNWSASSMVRRSGSYSFHGQVAPTQAAFKAFNTLELERGLVLSAASAVTYYWWGYYFDNCEARLEISTDEKHWEVLRTHTTSNHSGAIIWNSVTIPAAELTAYVDQPAVLRWSVEHNGGNYSYGSTPGFYVDDFSISSVRSGTWSTLSSALSAPPYPVQVTSSGDYLYRVRSQWNGQWWDYSDVEAVRVELPVTVTLQGKVLLQGAAQSDGNLHTHLLTRGLIPVESPYAEAPLSAAAIPAATTDWVLLQLYESDGVTLAKSQSALLRSDGVLMNTDGSVPLSLSSVIPSKSYYLVIRHRNHIRAMSAATLSFSTGSAAYDFTTDAGQYYGSDGAVQLETGSWALWAADGDQDGSVAAADHSLWNSAAQNGQQGYQALDFNLDGFVTSADYVPWYTNARAGAMTGMP